MKPEEFVERFSKFYESLTSFQKRIVDARLEGGKHGLLYVYLSGEYTPSSFRKRVVLYLLADLCREKSTKVSIGNWELEKLLKLAKNIPEKEIDRFYKSLIKNL